MNRSVPVAALAAAGLASPAGRATMTSDSYVLSLRSALGKAHL